MARKDAEAFYLDFVKRMAPKSNNYELYKETFARMTNADFERMVVNIRNGFILPIFYRNMSANKADVDAIMAIGEELGIEWFQHLLLTDHLTGEVNKTPYKYLILKLTGRRQIQHLRDKISIPTNDRKIDHLTGQATGESKGASITAPELQVLDDKGLERSVFELAKARGGDKDAYDSLQQQIADTGGFSLSPIESLGSRPQATITLRKLLLAGHLDSSGLGDESF